MLHYWLYLVTSFFIWIYLFFLLSLLFQKNSFVPVFLAPAFRFIIPISLLLLHLTPQLLPIPSSPTPPPVFILPRRASVHVHAFLARSAASTLRRRILKGSAFFLSASTLILGLLQFLIKNQKIRMHFLNEEIKMKVDYRCLPRGGPCIWGGQGGGWV